ncbi:DUF748 domain-containing protein [Oleiphilus sp. HI0125]|uniref:DUF748 domain-containing protein n=1 Tax=Oleiphilus sp. HI0125 TaxID=1822266 RepID=UPI000AEEE04D|nr:DUF748 domain-containing protein [Oleiphilus sp. HI0125]
MYTLLNRLLALVIVLIIASLLLVWLLSPYLIQYYAPKVLVDYKLQLSDASHVRLNPFKGAVSIEDFQLINTKDKNLGIEISEAVIDLNFWSLTQNVVSFDTLDFDNIQLNIERNGDAIRVAAFDIPENSNQNEQETNTNNDATPTAWSLNIPLLEIDALSIEFSNNDKQHSAQLNKFNLSELTLASDSLRGTFHLDALVNDAALNLDTDFDFHSSDEGLSGQASFSSSLAELQTKAFAYLAQDFTSRAEGAISYEINGQLSLDKAQNLTLELTNTNVVLENVTLNIDPFIIRESSLNISTSELSLGRSSEGVLNSNGIVSLEGEDLELGPSNKKDILIAINALSIPSIDYELKDSGLSIGQIASITVRKLLASKVIQTDENEQKIDPTPLLTLNSIHVDQLYLNPNNLSIETIELEGLNANVFVDAEQNVSNLVTVHQEAHEQVEKADAEKADVQNEIAEQEQIQEPNAQSAEQPAEQEAFGFSLSKFALKDQGMVNFIYEGVTPSFKQSLNIDKLTLAKLDSTTPESFAQLHAMFTAGQYTSAEIKSELAPFKDKTNLSLEMNLKEFSLPKISPFIRTAAGFDMSAGQLDSETKVSVVDDEIDGTVDLHIRGLEIDNAGDVHSGSIAEQTFIPLNLALSSLEDSNGRIELDIPLKGNVNNPDFGLNGFINLVAQRAALAASQSYLINTFVPYANIVTLTTIAGSYALKPRVEPLYFDEGEVELDEEQKAFADKLDALLNDKEDIHIGICGFALPDEDDENPKALANQRAENLKQYLVNEKKLASSRILICKSKVDTREDAKARVEFTF